MKKLKKTVLLTLEVELKDDNYITDLKEYIESVLENQLQTDECDFIEDWDLSVESFESNGLEEQND